MDIREEHKLRMIEVLATRLVEVLKSDKKFGPWASEFITSIKNNPPSASFAIDYAGYDPQEVANQGVKDALEALGLEIFQSGDRPENLS